MCDGHIGSTWHIRRGVSFQSDVGKTLCTTSSFACEAMVLERLRKSLLCPFALASLLAPVLEIARFQAEIDEKWLKIEWKRPSFWQIGESCRSDARYAERQ